MTEDGGRKKKKRMNIEHRTLNVERRVSSIEYRASKPLAESPQKLQSNFEDQVSEIFQISRCRFSETRPAFSLMEVLIAVGTLALGMLFIASVFPAGVYWTTVASERTISAVAADEAFAKIKLYGVNISGLSPITQTQVESVSSIYSGEYGYPSYGAAGEQKKYWWSAICRKIDTNDVQVTVFVSRKIGAGTKYPNLIDPNRPIAVKVGVTGIVGNNELTITGNKTFINDGYTIVDDTSGQIYRVLERYRSPDDRIRLDKNWQGGNAVWVIPPPVGGGRYPCIAVYQKVMRF
jgi:hypothetical protein